MKVSLATAAFFGAPNYRAWQHAKPLPVAVKVKPTRATRDVFSARKRNGLSDFVEGVSQSVSQSVSQWMDGWMEVFFRRNWAKNVLLIELPLDAAVLSSSEQ